MSKKTERIELRVTKEDKELIKNKARKLGYRYVTPFMVNSAENHFMIDLDLSHFDEVANEINYIGKNINNLVHHIFSTGYYSDYDLKEIQRLQNEIFKRVNKEYDYLLKIKRKYDESNMSLKDKERLIKELNKHEIEVPKEVILDEVYEQIRNNILYICQAIESSPEQEEGIADYVYEYMYDGLLYGLNEESLIDFANDIYLFTEKIKMKLLNVTNVFDDNNLMELKDILNEYGDNLI